MKLLVFLISLILISCSPAVPAPSPTQAVSLSTETLTAVPSETPAPTTTVTPADTATPTTTSTPVYSKLRGKVIINQAVCHYGPGAPYLYKYGVYKDYNLELLSRDPQGIYIEIQAIGGNNPCWVKAEYFEIKGELSSLKPIMPEEVKLPWSPYYAPPIGVKASRSGDEVTITWQPLSLKAGDDSEQTPYIVEAWVCQNGELIFQPIGSYQAVVKVNDQTGCSQSSRGRLLAAEKHGYTRPVEIPWPE